ncbi:CRISPR-associated protein Cas4 [Fonticella tunisiensis]|uniref:CRISPR-associated exonuclease Cas4 n=1 Tax=Fonticella tunisiensis TaxID=1096341 RepID=A0A4V3ES31_9CLOT|nr:CRISPR-associated protein Cas4 [Fonticella tunisiensis]TDT51940.1 CRISPR-associated Cas4 family exonuclease [Fonticella tunisiensis]
MDVNGTLVWYYKICKREVYLMSHGIVPDQEDDNIEIGRFIHENYYRRNDKEIRFGNVVFDVVYQDGNKLVIGETKKSSKFLEASKWQLMYYLKVLKEAGIEASGVLQYPEERRRVEIKLTDENIKELKKIEAEIIDITNSKVPPKIEECIYCKNCAYREYCYA